MADTETGRRENAASEPETAVKERDTAEERETAAKENANPPWGAVGVVTAVLVAGAFVSGWQLGRRWHRFLGW